MNRLGYRVARGRHEVTGDQGRGRHENCVHFVVDPGWFSLREAGEGRRIAQAAEWKGGEGRWRRIPTLTVLVGS